MLSKTLEEYNKKQYETQLRGEKIIKGRRKDCECEPHEIIYFKGDKCEKTHSNYNRPLLTQDRWVLILWML